MSEKVIVLGGGVAGMSAAHELIERGFEVEVYEKHRIYPGGKARSINVPGTNKPNPELYLPGEHGFRFFPGFYKHVTDTMKRIPFKNNSAGVYDNLSDVTRVGLLRSGKAPIMATVNFPRSLSDLKALIHSMHANTGLTSEEKTFFAHKVWQLMTSCYDRRLNEYEKLGWWDFLEADRFSKTYQALLVQGLTRTLVAANAKKASTKTGGDIFLQLLFNMSNPGVNTDRVLNGPTNDVWINPWLDYLKSKGVTYNFNWSAVALDMKDGKISGAWVETYKKGVPQKKLVTGDYYILATPVEVASGLLSPEMLKADPTLEGVQKLAPSVAWMNGMQFYLSEEIDIVHGHCIYSDSPWAITSISQLQFWNDFDMTDRYDGKVKTILSIDISDWETDGILEFDITDPKTGKTKKGKKPARDCTYTEIMKDVWAQLKQSLNVDGKEVLKDDQILHWYIDHDITVEHHKDDTNKEPLLVNTINSWDLRPEAYTRIPNFFLASDYVRTFTDLATMEGANEAARRAVNAILEATDSTAELCKVWNLHEPDILSHLRNRDQKRYNQGLPYQFHLPFWAKLMEKIIMFFKNLFSKK
ncbi:FAD-dependent oxidoreductase [Saccharicrinis sp. FJH54]|uniref:hydroxysqualene dehydroxylase n=1 Tax=Saccharicrinis sp. FJH54 TaxID=3344665 RepID=UPI0035D40786